MYWAVCIKAHVSQAAETKYDAFLRLDSVLVAYSLGKVYLKCKKTTFYQTSQKSTI